MLLLILLFLSFNTCFAQTVSDFNLNTAINMDGIYIEQDTLYVAEGWNGSRVFKIAPDGIVSVFATGLNGPIDIVRRSNGLFYVSEWNQARIAEISSAGMVTAYVTVLAGPGPMTMDSLENIYVTHNVNDGSGFITKITTNNSTSIFASGAPLINPGGITLDNLGNFFVANFNNGNIIKIDTSLTMSIFSTIPVSGTWKTGHLKYNDNNLYVSSLAGSRIFKITTTGNVSTYAGSGLSGHLSGAALSARFSNPDGLAFTQDGTKLFVGKAFGSANYIQVIDKNTISTIEHIPIQNNQLNIYPNPIIDRATITYKIEREAFVDLSLVSQNGEVISNLVHQKQSEGSYKIDFGVTSFPQNIAYLVLKIGKNVTTKKIFLTQ